MKTKFDFEKLLNFLKKNRYVLLVMMTGLVLMLVPWGGKDGILEPVLPLSSEVEEMGAGYSLHDMERKMEKILSKIDGAGNVTVMLTPKNSAEQMLYPEYRGALVVSEGAGSPMVNLQLTEAVANLTGLGVDKITVTKMQEGK